MNRKFYTKFILNIFISLIISLFIIFILYLPNILVYEFNNSINVFAWPSTFDKDMISKFENENNIKVNISYYSTNEELISKLQATNSNGYDIVIPSDYAVNILKNGNLLQKIDKSKLNFYNKLNPALLGHYFDIHNDYSIPFEWAIFGIGIDKNFFTVDGKYYKPSSLDVLFNNIYNFSGIEKNYKVIMSDDPYVSIAIALLYIFKNLDQISVEHIQKVKELLKYQYSFIEAYSENKADYYLVTGNCPVALASSSYIWRSMKKYKNLDFIIPQDGSILTIESFCISKNASNIDIIYKFLNFIFDDKNIINNFEKFSFFPPTITVFDKINVDSKIKDIISINKKDIEKFKFLEFDKLRANNIDEFFMQNLWIDIKN